MNNMNNTTISEIITSWTGGNAISLHKEKSDENTRVFFRLRLVPLLETEEITGPTHLAKEFRRAFYATNGGNKIFSNGVEVTDEKVQNQIITTWINNNKRPSTKKQKVHHNDDKVHLTDGSTSLSPPVSVVSNNTAAASNFTNNNNFNSLATGGGMDTGGLQSKKVQHRDNKFSAPTTGMHLSSHLFHPVPSVVSNTTAASNNFTAGTELSISLPPDEDNGMGGMQLQSEMVQHHQRKSPTSVDDIDMAAAAGKLLPDNNKVGTMGNLVSSGTATTHSANHQPYLPEKRQEFDNFLNNMPFSPGKPTGSESGGGVSSTNIVSQSQLTQLEYSTDRKLETIVEQMSKMSLEFGEMKAKVGELEAKVEEKSKLLEYFCSKDKKEE